MKKILFVEDEAVLQKTLTEILKNEGYKVVNALDGESGLRLAKSQKPDLVLLDIVLPRLQGLEVLKAIKDDPETKDIPVIILTNLESSQEIEKALAFGATTYLLKTQYTLPEITEKIKSAIGE